MSSNYILIIISALIIGCVCTWLVLRPRLRQIKILDEEIENKNQELKTANASLIDSNKELSIQQQS